MDNHFQDIVKYFLRAIMVIPSFGQGLVCRAFASLSSSCFLNGFHFIFIERNGKAFIRSIIYFIIGYLNVICVNPAAGNKFTEFTSDCMLLYSSLPSNNRILLTLAKTDASCVN